jgi:hypothetical protein
MKLMKLEDQVCSLELAQKLKELEYRHSPDRTDIFVQNSLYYWVKHKSIDLINPEPFYYLEDNIEAKRSLQNDLVIEIYSAYTTGELVEMLPITFQHQGDECFLKMTKGRSNYYEVEYTYTGVSGSPLQKFGMADSTFANSIAKMLIHLMKRNLL